MTLALYSGKVAGTPLFSQLITWPPRCPISRVGRGGLAATWLFSVGEGLKMAATIALFVVEIGTFKTTFVPLYLTYLSALIMQVLAPAVINNKG